MRFATTRTRCSSVGGFNVWDDYANCATFFTRRSSLEGDNVNTSIAEDEDGYEAIARVLPYYLDSLVDWGGVLERVFRVGEPDWQGLGLLPHLRRDRG